MTIIIHAASTDKHAVKREDQLTVTRVIVARSSEFNARKLLNKRTVFNLNNVIKIKTNIICLKDFLKKVNLSGN